MAAVMDEESIKHFCIRLSIYRDRILWLYDSYPWGWTWDEAEGTKVAREEMLHRNWEAPQRVRDAWGALNTTDDRRRVDRILEGVFQETCNHICKDGPYSAAFRERNKSQRKEIAKAR